MKNLILALSLLLTATAAHATDESSIQFSCVPGNQPNGLGIERIVFDLSTDDPQGVVTLTYQNSGVTLVSDVDYEADAKHYEVTPSSHKLGDLSFLLTGKNHIMTKATVKSDSIDTFSVLECEVL